MIEVNGTKILMTRGDNAPFTITFTGDDTPEDGEKVLFSVKQNAMKRESVIEKEVYVQNGAVEIEIMNADTKRLDFGEYEWDIRFPNMMGEGEPFTPIKPQPFVLCEVIGNV